MTKLLNIFVNSMVRQIGRDSGKVVTNKIFGDAHATPIRMVGEKQHSYQTENKVNSNEYSQIDELNLINYHNPWLIGLLGVLIVSWFGIIPIIGALLLIYDIGQILSASKYINSTYLQLSNGFNIELSKEAKNKKKNEMIAWIIVLIAKLPFVILGSIWLYYMIIK